MFTFNVFKRQTIHLFGHVPVTNETCLFNHSNILLTNHDIYCIISLHLVFVFCAEVSACLFRCLRFAISLACVQFTLILIFCVICIHFVASCSSIALYWIRHVTIHHSWLVFGWVSEGVLHVVCNFLAYA